MSLPTRFSVHDNGGRPFRVTLVDENNLDVEVGTYDAQARGEIYHHWRSFTFQKIFIGKGEYDVVSDEPIRAYGNSVLLHVEGLKYVFIGERIFEFTAFDPIVKFIGTACNSDVVYAFAVDSKGKHYFIEGPIVHCIQLSDEEANNTPSHLFEFYYNSPQREQINPTILHERLY
mmetsp:Transcript_31587/g.34530  ORF Transcript_31587/g.34530 Transcript_31587/m.34530 type:complete len:174 (+) Transcript_31587:67-588(+)